MRPIVATSSVESMRAPLSFGDGVRWMVRAAQGLPIAGWEVSCRIAPGGVSTDRLLMGFPVQGVSDRRLNGLATVLQMPQPLADEFQRDLGATAQILLAVESTVGGLEFRVYQSFSAIASGMRGFKWVHHEPQAQRITEYTRETMTLEMVATRYDSALDFSRHFGIRPRPVAFGAAATIARTAMRRGAPHQAVDFFSVKERSGQRASTCFRLYDSGLMFTDVAPVVMELLMRYRLELEWPRIRTLMANRALGWLAVGEDGVGIPFLTVYAEASVLDARRFMVVGASQ